MTAAHGDAIFRVGNCAVQASTRRANAPPAPPSESTADKKDSATLRRRQSFQRSMHGSMN
jgi:hypothetical protein